MHIIRTAGCPVKNGSLDAGIWLIKGDVANYQKPSKQLTRNTSHEITNILEHFVSSLPILLCTRGFNVKHIEIEIVWWVLCLLKKKIREISKMYIFILCDKVVMINIFVEGMLVQITRYDYKIGMESFVTGCWYSWVALSGCELKWFWMAL